MYCHKMHKQTVSNYFVDLYNENSGAQSANLGLYGPS